MFNRRMLVALAVCLTLSASTVFAGGGGGTKKDVTINVQNDTGVTVFAFVDVSDAAITAAGKTGNPAAAFKALGGKEVAVGGKPSFSVFAGNHTVTVVDPNPAAPRAGKKGVSTSKGDNVTVVFTGADLGPVTL